MFLEIWICQNSKFFAKLFMDISQALRLQVFGNLGLLFHFASF